MIRIINADVIDGLKSIPEKSVHCVVTSPPYWGLRDIMVWRTGILFPEMKSHVDYSFEHFVAWPFLDWLAVLDGIEPATGEELGRVILEMNELVPTENNLLGELEMQVIRWTTDCRR